jgi:hypothetical protein
MFDTLPFQTGSIRGIAMAKRSKKAPRRKRWSADDVKLLRKHSRERTPVALVAKTMKRSEGAVRQKALSLGIGLGHRR